MNALSNNWPEGKFSRVARLTLVVVSLVLLQSWESPGAAADQAVSPAVEQAVLAENWAQVVTLLKEVNPQTPSPVLRLIKGHACLAVNRNNESRCLFLSVATDAEKQAWQKWTEDFANRNSAKPAAYYLKGDGLARLEKWSAGETAFGQALNLKPEFALALSARGVSYAAQHQYENSLKDFAKAAAANPTLADAYANRGALYIQKKSGARGALRWFNEALKNSREFALALFQRGCIKLVLGDYQGGQKDVEEAKRQKGCLDKIIAANREELASWMASRDKLELAEAKGEDPGTEISRGLGKLDQGDVDSLKGIARTLGNHPEYAQTVNQKINDIRANNPELGRKIDQKIADGREWTSETGGGKGWLKFLGSGFEGGVGKAQVGVKVSENFIDQHLEKTTKDYKGWNAINIKSDPQGGVTTRPEKMRVEEGNWPFSASYGLCYDVKQ